MSHNTPHLEWRSDPPLAAESITLRSDAGVDYLIRRAMPEATTETPLPAIIVLDGANHFTGFAAIAQRLSQRPDATGVTPAIVIGIDSVPPLQRRFEDFTPWPPENDADKPLQTTGGAASFLEMLVERIVPALLSDGSVDAARLGLVGHSLSGYFALYAASQTRAFSSIGAFSPSIWWNAPRLSQALQASDLSTTTFTLSAGSRENHATRRMIENARELADMLKARSAHATMVLAADEDHASTPFASFPAYLRAL